MWSLVGRRGVVPLGFALISVSLAIADTAWGQSKVTLEVQPATVEVSPWYERVQVRVIAQNGLAEALDRPKLIAFTNDSLSVKVDSLAATHVRPLESVVWTVWVQDLKRARLPGTIQFEINYTVATVPGVQRSFATLTVKPPTGAASAPIEITVQGSFDAVTETRPALGRLTFKNNLDVPVRITSVSVLRPDEKSFLSLPSIEPFDVPERSTESRTLTLAAAPRVTPGKHAVAFSVKAQWEEGGHRHERQFVVEKEATVGVFFESEVLKLLSVPSFLLLPGALFLFSMQLLVTLGVLGVGRYSKVPDVPVTSPGFWIVAVTFSGVFAWVYAWLTGTDYLVRYGASDLRNVWLSSIALGTVTFLVLALITRHRRQQRVPDTEDDQIATLEKLSRRGREVLANRVRFNVNNVGVSALMLEPIEEGQTLVWVAPLIVATWTGTTNEALEAQETARKLIDRRADPAELAQCLRTARDNQPQLVVLTWETASSVPNPYHLKVDSITQYAGREAIVRMS